MFEAELDLQKELEQIIKNVSDTESILIIGAEEFVKDLLKLSKPKSKIKATGYTHLVDSFSYRKSKRHNGEIEVGWGKYYGPMVENGTKLMDSQPHLKPTFNKNKEKYYKSMIDKIYK